MDWVGLFWLECEFLLACLGFVLFCFLGINILFCWVLLSFLDGFRGRRSIEIRKRRESPEREVVEQLYSDMYNLVRF